MFAYCGNNPVNKRDPSGHIAVEICISADGLSNILGLDWMGGCGSGGVAFAIGAVSSGSRVNLTAEKKAVRRFVNEVGTSIRSGAEAFWDAYAHSLELQARMQEQRDMAIMAFFEDAFSSPGRAGDFVWMNINNTLTCIELVAFIAAPTVCKGIALALDIGGSIWSTTRFFGKIPD